MNCIILDDEPHAIDILRRYIESTSTLKLVGTYRNPVKALEALQFTQVDLIFLDINMPGLTGMQFLQSLRKKALIVFTTAYPSYAAESYEWDAVDYLVKPIVLERFLKAVAKSFEQFQNKNLISSQKAHRLETAIISIKSGPIVHRVNVDDILFVSKDGNYLVINLSDKKVLIRANMSDVFSILSEELFCRIHKSFVVSLKHLETIVSHQVRIGKIILPLAPNYRENFNKKMNEHS